MLNPKQGGNVTVSRYCTLRGGICDGLSSLLNNINDDLLHFKVTYDFINMSDNYFLKIIARSYIIHSQLIVNCNSSTVFPLSLISK